MTYYFSLTNYRGWCVQQSHNFAPFYWVINYLYGRHVIMIILAQFLYRSVIYLCIYNKMMCLAIYGKVTTTCRKSKRENHLNVTYKLVQSSIFCKMAWKVNFHTKLIHIFLNLLFIILKPIDYFLNIIFQKLYNKCHYVEFKTVRRFNIYT